MGAKLDRRPSKETDPLKNVVHDHAHLEVAWKTVGDDDVDLGCKLLRDYVRENWTDEWCSIAGCLTPLFLPGTPILDPSQANVSGVRHTPLRGPTSPLRSSESPRSSRESSNRVTAVAASRPIPSGSTVNPSAPERIKNVLPVTLDGRQSGI
ncbi:hypothetical protein QCA50_016958 [Cerrena zonata]|uniref:Uncharacterized protein n=1 Tax=Cerrena zonata TaxID=2478898 RepID=A0AAW0FL13_9APHY